MCRNKKSRVDECMTNTQVGFKFDSCKNEFGHESGRGGKGTIMDDVTNESGRGGKGNFYK